MWNIGMTLKEVEKEVILKAYSFYQKNKTKTAQALGIAIRTLDSRLDEYEKEKTQLPKSKFWNR